MIDPRELRIGNLITDIWAPDGSAFEVVLLSSKYPIVKYGNNLSANCRNLKPIPLTEELLVKAGFKKETNEYFLIKHEYSNLLIFYSKIHNRFWYFADVERRQYNSTKPIEYLHQLQNLYFALTGTELTIKL